MDGNYGFLTRVYYLSLKAISFLQQAITLPFEAFWLGVLDRESLHQLDDCYYNNNLAYLSKEYNNQGFFEWEEKAVREHFSKCRSILVAGAGAGREMLALIKSGYSVSGFECNNRLAKLANKTFRENGYNAEVILSERDDAVETENVYDGVIVGWAVYMHIFGSDKRIEFLKQIRKNTAHEGPLLISFFTKKGNPKHYTLIASAGNIIRRLLGRKKIEAGDRLAPNFIHYFSREELENELVCAGYALSEFSAKQYGYAVSKAV